MLQKKKTSKAIKQTKKKTPPKAAKVSKVEKVVAVQTAEPVEKMTKEVSSKKRTYVFAVGRRKSSVARVRYYKNASGELIINGKSIQEYFPQFELQKIIREPLALTNQEQSGQFTVKVVGGGKRGQAESIRLGVSRILLATNSDYRPLLRSKGLLTRDPRVKERKKYGLKKARRAPQWQKR